MGVFVNTTWVHYYDIGRYEDDKAFFWGPGGQLDFYLLIGKTMPELIARHTEITGQPRLLPEFGYAHTYVSQITQKRAMNHYCATYAGVQHWGATTMGDNGGEQNALVWMLNYAMSGHTNTSCDMVTTPQGMHFGFFATMEPA